MLSIGICICMLSLSADRVMDVSQLVEEVTSVFAIDRNDKRIGRSLKSVQLTERLTPEMIDLLVKLGVGPETARVLDDLRKRSAALPAPAREALSTVDVPSDTDQAVMVAKMKRYAAEYLSRLPNFIATRKVKQFRNYQAETAQGAFRSYEQKTITVDDRWHEALTYTTEAAYIAGHAYIRKEVAANPAHPVSIGEFGGMMEEIFGAGRQTAFTWDRWQILGGLRTAVFSYRVGPESSRYLVCCTPRQQYVRVGHQGSVFVDSESGAVIRLVLHAGSIADGLDTGHVLDYSPVQIGSDHYTLPSRSTAYVKQGIYESREEISYLNYSKFTAEAEISFVEESGSQQVMPAKR